MSGAMRSYCPRCGVTFVSLAAFDYHRVGLYTPQGRRCLTLDEMQAEGMVQEDQGIWGFDPARPRPSPADLMERYSLLKQEGAHQTSRQEEQAL